MRKFILVVLALILSACSAGSEYDQNLKKWQEAEVSHYRYNLVIGCFCPFYQDMPLTVEVRNEEVVSITRVDGTPVDASDPNHEYYVKYATIDRLFAELESEMAEAEEVTAVYDPELGFPAEVSIDVVKLAMDDELSWQVTNFEVLE
ncbi:MAG: DUF6174 domain-containing protein [Anaerolineales bacterium]|nr:DUF6174 domain-containing protein [Anaerolineales bacterium]